MSMNITYTVFDENDKIISNAKEEACFGSVDYNSKHSIEVKIKKSKQNKDLQEFWIDIVKAIEPSAVSTETDITFPMSSFNSRKHLLMILTILRYLWEPSYDDIPRLTKNIIEASPEIDKFLAVVLASSILTQQYNGWGHSLVNSTTEVKRTIEDYKSFNMWQMHDLFLDDKILAKDRNLHKELERLVKLKIHRYDVAPILDKFEVPYDKSKIIEYVYEKDGK
jgi:hypothetical protein